MMKKFRAWLGALLWMGVIFFMSAMPGDVSGEQSGQIAQLVLSALSFLFGRDAAERISPDMINLLVRKAAHMTEYAILFLLYRRALAKSGARRPGITALCLCACYAATDETHQAFVSDRGPSVIDVGIDTIGAALAFGARSIILRLLRRRRGSQEGASA